MPIQLSFFEVCNNEKYRVRSSILEDKMPNRSGGTCVAGDSTVIFEDKSMPTIDCIDVVCSIEIDIEKNTANPIWIHPDKVKPIKTMSGKFVWPTIRFKFLEEDNYPLVKICVKIPELGREISTNPAEEGDEVHTLVATRWHPVLNEDKKFTYASLLLEGDKIWTYSNNFPFPRLGIVMDLPENAESNDIYGLIVTTKLKAIDIYNERNQLDSAPFLQAQEKRVLSYSRVNNYLLRWVHQNLEKENAFVELKEQTYGLNPLDHVIITSQVASGTITIQEPLIRKFRKGLSLKYLMAEE